MKIVALEKWTPCDGIALEDNADFVVRTKNNVLVVAGPGAGKTELLAQKACYLFQTNICKDPQKILAISFKKDAAENLKDRVVKRCRREIGDRFISMTYDAFFKNILDRFRLALPKNLRPEANYLVNDTEVVEAAFKHLGFNNSQNLSHSKLNAYYENVLNSVELPFSQKNIGSDVWKLLLKGFDNHKAALSFNMISKLAEYIIRTNPKIKQAIQLTYKYVFLDEFQDTTDLQYNFVKQCFLHSNSIMTAVGDNKQRIMAWAGARKTIFNDFKTEFNAEEQILIMNHRSAPRLVELQKMMYSSLNEFNINIGVSEKWDPNDGKIKLLIAKDDTIEAKVISEQIVDRIKSGVEPNQLCILCKQRAQEYTSKLIDELKSHHICARLESDFQDLINEPIVKILIALLRLTIDRKRPEEWKLIVSVVSELYNTNSLQSNEVYYRMQDDLEVTMMQLGKMIENTKCQNDFNTLLNHAIQFLGYNRIKATFPTYGQGTYLNDILNKFKNYMWKEIESTQMDWLLAFENFEGLHSIPIMTIHKSKGLEFDTVYFIGLEDSAFWNFKNQPEEDRCAFFVAISRAKKELMFTFSEMRRESKYPKQSHDQINEFFELLSAPGVADIIGTSKNEE